MTPRTLDELRAVADPAARAVAAKAYIEHGESRLADARKIRDAAIRKYLETHGVTETARACGVSVSLVKVLKR